MKQIILIAIGIIILIIGIARAEDFKVNVSTDFKLEILEDGKLIGSKKIVHLHIYDYQGKLHATWEHVGMIPMEKDEKIILTSNHFSSHDGEIKDITVSDSSFEFTFEPIGGYPMKIVGIKKEFMYDVKGVGFIKSVLENKYIKVEWRTTDKIILPYKEVL